MTGESRQQVVRYTMDQSAATGEGERFITGDGQEYHIALPFEPVVGTLRDGYIHPGSQ